jgi:hypothetical protein
MARQQRQPVASVPTILLAGEEESRYVCDLVRILKGARLNAYYPDARRMASHVACLAPEVHQGLYPHLQVDQRSGLPTYREWTRVQTDVQIAPQALADLRSREVLVEKARAAPRSIFGKQLLKHDYYSAIIDSKLAPLSRMDVALRRIEPEKRTAWFRVLLDKLDASGLFVRYTIDLAQESKVWSKNMVTLDADTAGHTDAFRSLIYKFTSLDAEFTYAKLVALGNLTVERVVKGTVGPVVFSGVRTSLPLAGLIQKSGEVIAAFSLDTAATDLAADRDNDPMDDLLVDRLSERARAEYQSSRSRYGYKVFKDRKFVVTSDLMQRIRDYCQKAGTRNIVYAMQT